MVHDLVQSAARFVVLVVCVLAARAGAGPADLFRVGRTHATGAVVLVPGAEPIGGGSIAVDDARASPMLARLMGTLAFLDKAQVRQLAGAARANRLTIEPSDPQLRPVVEIVLIGDGATKRVAIVRDDAGALYARGVGRNATIELARLDTTRWHELARSWSAYAGPLDAMPEGITPGVSMRLPGTLTPGAVVFDAREIKRRLARGTAIRMTPTTRVLGHETLTIRLPAGYDPRRPSGLLVWIDPSPRGQLPEALGLACDELNLVGVGAVNAGNERPVMDRFELAMDGVGTAMDRFHIDRSRVYLVGMSGGGRAASMLWGAYPDLFAGAVAIVGLNSYRRALTPQSTILPATYAKPSGRLMALLRTRRLAAITGVQDFNYDSILLYAQGLVRDRLPVRVFEYPDMGHTMPTPGRFSSAMRWVDEPQRTPMVQARAKARQRLREVRKNLAQDESPGPGARAVLVEITRLAPWSDPAWEAAAMLGYAPGDRASD